MTTRLQSALSHVPRAEFVFPQFAEASANVHLPAGEGQNCPPQIVVRQLIDALQIDTTSNVLEIGTATGYTAAVMSQIAKHVWTVERVKPLAQSARRLLEVGGYTNVTVLVGNGLQGYSKAAPYDGILVSAAVEEIPERLLSQLNDGGCLVHVAGAMDAEQLLIRVTRRGDDFEREELGPIQFVERLGDVLVDIGAAPRLVVEDAVESAKTNRQLLGQELIDLGQIHEIDLYRALARQRGLSWMTVDEILGQIDSNFAHQIPRPFLDKNRIIPISQHGSAAKIAVTDPNMVLHGVAAALGTNSLEIVLVTPTDYQRVWAALDLGWRPEVEASVVRHDEDLLGSDKADPHLVALFEALLLDAIGERASDIHLERYEDDTRIRFRVDGRLRDVPRFRLNPRDSQGLVQVVKVAANLDIMERRLPQGGRIRRRAGDRVFDLRVQTQPSLYGEHVIIRLLPQDVRILDIEDLGFNPDLAEHYRRLIDSPQGLVLVVGPTGSGKSTTLYAALKILAADAHRKVITAEDPVEYAIRDIQQTQIKPEIGFAFADAMRAFVREDPDVIFVGEIRDAETAMEAIRASQTGHLVLSTLHCNDTVDAVQRLYDLGMHPNSIASELIAVISQRLARRICDSCRQEAEPSPELVQEVFAGRIPRGFTFFEGAGCGRCGNQGSYGRVAVAELLTVDADFRMAIGGRMSTDLLREKAVKNGLITMRENALALVKSGEIALSELPRILSIEQLAQT